jgi:hypothetical protein
MVLCSISCRNKSTTSSLPPFRKHTLLGLPSELGNKIHLWLSSFCALLLSNYPTWAFFSHKWTLFVALLRGSHLITFLVLANCFKTRLFGVAYWSPISASTLPSPFASVRNREWLRLASLLRRIYWLNHQKLSGSLFQACYFHLRLTHALLSPLSQPLINF